MQCSSSCDSARRAEYTVTNPPMIQTCRLSHAYSANSGVWDLDLVVPSGSIYAFIGPNGAGKTTTIRLLLGLLRATTGQILINGMARSVDSRALPRIGSLVEGPSLYPHLTGRQNLRISALLLGCNRRQIEDVLHIVGLLDAADRLVKQYSLGMRQRLGLALALLGKPRLLILDEPSNGLDPQGMAEMRSLLSELAKNQGLTIFLSSHLLDDIEKIATHVGLLHQGRLLAQGELDKLRRNSLRVKCSNPGAAIALLTQAGRSVQQVEDALLVDAPAADAAVINRELVLAGIDVHALAVEQDTLEQFYRLATSKTQAA